jgi:hypothetical protein
MAFPDGIPNSILVENKHDQPLKDQGNDLVFAPIERDHDDVSGQACRDNEVRQENSEYGSKAYFI